MMRNILLLAILLVTTQGCSSIIKPVDSMSESSDNNIIMLRNYNYINGGGHFWPTVNGKKIAGIYPKEHVAFNLDEGEYVLGVDCFGGWVPMWHSDEIEVRIIEQEKRYFLLSLFVTGCAEIEEIEEREAKERLKDSMRIETGKIADCDGNSLAYEGYEAKLCFSNAIP